MSSAPSSDTTELPVQLLWIARYDYSPGDQLEPHQHDFYQLIYIIQGDILLEFGCASPTPLNQGALILIPPGQSHGWVTGEHECFTVDLKFRINRAELVEALGTEILAESFNESTQMLHEMLSLLQMASEGSPWQKRLLNLSLEKLLIHWLHHRTPGYTPLSPLLTEDPVCLSLLEVIHHHMQQWPDQQGIANLTGYSYRHLSQRSQLAWQMTPQQVLHYCRVQRSCELLLDQGNTVSMVAQRVGYQTEQHLARHFKRLIGKSPGRWRQTLQHHEYTLDEHYINQLYLKP